MAKVHIPGIAIIVGIVCIGYLYRYGPPQGVSKFSSEQRIVYEPTDKTFEHSVPSQPRAYPQGYVITHLANIDELVRGKNVENEEPARKPMIKLSYSDPDNFLIDDKNKMVILLPDQFLGFAKRSSSADISTSQQESTSKIVEDISRSSDTSGNVFFSDITGKIFSFKGSASQTKCASTARSVQTREYAELFVAEYFVIEYVVSLNLSGSEELPKEWLEPEFVERLTAAKTPEDCYEIVRDYEVLVTVKATLGGRLTKIYAVKSVYVMNDDQNTRFSKVSDSASASFLVKGVKLGGGVSENPITTEHDEEMKEFYENSTQSSTLVTGCDPNLITAPDATSAEAWAQSCAFNYASVMFKYAAAATVVPELNPNGKITTKKCLQMGGFLLTKYGPDGLPKSETGEALAVVTTRFVAGMTGTKDGLLYAYGQEAAQAVPPISPFSYYTAVDFVPKKILTENSTNVLFGDFSAQPGSGGYAASSMFSVATMPMMSLQAVLSSDTENGLTDVRLFWNASNGIIENTSISDFIGEASYAYQVVETGYVSLSKVPPDCGSEDIYCDAMIVYGDTYTKFLTTADVAAGFVPGPAPCGMVDCSTAVDIVQKGGYQLSALTEGIRFAPDPSLLPVVFLAGISRDLSGTGEVNPISLRIIGSQGKITREISSTYLTAKNFLFFIHYGVDIGTPLEIAVSSHLPNGTHVKYGSQISLNDIVVLRYDLNVSSTRFSTWESMCDWVAARGTMPLYPTRYTSRPKTLSAC